MEYTVSVSVATVDKCGQQSEAGVALHRVPAFTETVATEKPVVEQRPFIASATSGPNTANQRIEGIKYDCAINHLTESR